MSDVYTSISEARQLLLATLRPTPSVETLEPRKALGRVLAEDIVAAYDIPPYNASHMDGYAVKSEDVALASPQSPARLKLKAKVVLGEEPRLELGHGEAIAVPTGGFLPRGADAVVPLEEAKVEDGYLVVTRPFGSGSYVYPRGATISKGQLALRKGVVLRPQDLGLLITLRRGRIRVYRRPNVVILPTGSELTDDPEREPHKVPNSHGPIIEGMVKWLGCRVKRLPVVPDELTKLVGALKAALREADVVLAISGSSVGEADLVERAISELGPLQAMIHGLKLDPGRRGGFAVLFGKPVFILPGLILGAVNVLLTLVLPLLKAMGCPEPSSVPAKMAVTWEARRRQDFTKVVYVALHKSSGCLIAHPILGETEKLTVLTQADGCIVIPEHITKLEAGDVVEALLLPGFQLTERSGHEIASGATAPQTSIQ